MNLISDDAPNEYRGVKEYFIKNMPLHYAIILTIFQYIILSIGIWKIINLLY